MAIVVEKARRLPRRTIYLAIVAFHLIATSAIGYRVLSNQVTHTWNTIESYRHARNHQLRAQERREQFNELLSRLSNAQRAASDNQPLYDVGAMTHSRVRQSAEKAGLQLKGFVATEVEDEHLVTFEGAFRSVVMLIDALPRDLSLFRVLRFTARSVPSRGGLVEVGMLIKRSPNPPELSPVCTRNGR
jgi:hypothetical protein